VILAAYESYNERDLDALLPLMCDDVNWANALTGDRIRGVEEMRRIWEMQWTSLNVRTEPIKIYDEPDGKTVVLVREILHEAGGRLLMDEVMEHVFTLRDGKVARMDFRHVARKAAQTIDIAASGV
jgi:ketosteroid isomerase-like protein